MTRYRDVKISNKTHLYFVQTDPQRVAETTQEAVCECRVLISKRETGTETITVVGETTEVADVFIRSFLNRAVRTRLP